MSHKHEDGALAQFLREALQPYGITVNISEDIDPGTKWHKWIKTKLRQSTLLLLLYSDTSSDWDWCLYEVGLFTSLPGQRTIAYIHAGDQRPRQLEHIQGVAATPTKIEAFLKSHLLGGHRSRQEKVASIAGELTKRLGRQRSSTTLHPHFDISVDAQWHGDGTDPIGGALADLPEGATIMGPAETGDVFGVGRPPWTWRDIRDRAHRAESQNLRWSVELARVLQDVARRKSAGKSMALYRRNDRTFRTLPYRVEAQANGTTKFSMLMVDESSWHLQQAVPSFGDLMREVKDLLDSTPPDDEIGWLAYTPALGFLARPRDEWDALHASMLDRIKQIRFTCLGPDELRTWHSRFVGTTTDRGMVDQDLVDQATNLSTELRRRNQHYRELPWRWFPQFYLFNNTHRAIVVTHFALPELEARGWANGDAPGNPEMFGAVTNHHTLVMRIARVHERYALGMPNGPSFRSRRPKPPPLGIG